MPVVHAIDALIARKHLVVDVFGGELVHMERRPQRELVALRPNRPLIPADIVSCTTMKASHDYAPLLGQSRPPIQGRQ